VKTATNKRLLISESRGDSNRCTPCRGKHDQHATRFPRSVRVWPSTICILRGPCIATFHESLTELDRVTASLKKGLLTQSTTRRSSDLRVHTQFLSWANQRSSRESQTYINSRLLGLLGTYHRYAIDTFNTCSWEPTHRSLTDTGEGYNLGDVDFPHITPRPFQPVVSTFHLRASPDLTLSIQQL
jgi:hypothetical protein